jgi:drug/metabolite transporter (DMT)-like permease
LTPAGWASLLFLAIGSTVLAYAWYFRGVAELGAGTAASYISLVPVFGVASAVLLLGEPMTPALLIGGALALAGVVIANRARR